MAGSSLSESSVGSSQKLNARLEVSNIVSFCYIQDIFLFSFDLDVEFRDNLCFTSWFTYVSFLCIDPPFHFLYKLQKSRT